MRRTSGRLHFEDDGHYLEVSRYIHLNPVRAHLADRPARWPG
jgi:hypothetical protein